MFNLTALRTAVLAVLSAVGLIWVRTKEVLEGGWVGEGYFVHLLDDMGILG